MSAIPSLPLGLCLLVASGCGGRLVDGGVRASDDSGSPELGADVDTDGLTDGLDTGADTNVSPDASPPDTFVPPTEKAWTIVATGKPPPLTSVWSNSPKSVWVGSQRDVPGFHLYQWSSGAGWTDAARGTNSESGVFRLTTLWGASDGDIWAGTNLYPYFGHFDGMALTFTPVSGVRYDGVYGLWGTSAVDIWAVGGNDFAPSDEILQHFDGTKWSDRRSGLSRASWRTIWGSSATNVWIGGWRGLAHWDGSAWVSSLDLADGASPILRISGRSSSDVWAITRNRLLHFDGVKWSDVAGAAPAGGALQSVSADFDGSAWIVGGVDSGAFGRGVIRHCKAFECWDVPDAKITVINDVWCAGPGDVWAVGAYTDGMTGWFGVALHRAP